MFFVVDPIPASQTEVKVLILAHGNGIATEMANAANELLGIDEVTGSICRYMNRRKIS